MYEYYMFLIDCYF